MLLNDFMNYDYDQRAKQLDRDFISEGIYWRSARQEQGYNVAVAEYPITMKQMQEISDISKQVDEFNMSVLSQEGEPPCIRLNRLDIMLDESGQPILIEQNPGWVDNLGFMSALSGDYSLLRALSRNIKEQDSEQLVLAYADVAAFGKYEMAYLARLLNQQEFLGSDMPILVQSVNEIDSTGPRKAVFLSAPESKLTDQERTTIKDLNNNERILCFPNISMNGLDNKSLLMRSNLPIPRSIVCPDTKEEFIAKVEEGFSVLKTVRGSSHDGVRIVNELNLVESFERSRQSHCILQQKINPRCIIAGTGYDYMRAKGKPMQPEKVDLAGRAVKLNVWTLNGAYSTVIGCAARDTQTLLIADSGFNFKLNY